MAANPPVMTYLRSHRAVAYAVIAAAVVVGFCAVVAIAWMLGWIPPQSNAPKGTPAQQAKAAGANEALDANESIVSPAEALARPEPLMPTYSKPHAPPPAPLPTVTASATIVDRPPTKAAPPPAPAPAPARGPVTNPDAIPASPTQPQRFGERDRDRDRETYAQADVTRPGPVSPSFSRRERTPESMPRADVAAGAVSDCDPCGVVSSITTYPGRWEVRVRLNGGGAQIFPFRSAPPYRIGDRVRIEGSRLLYD